jgi:hypothetical protein
MHKDIIGPDRSAQPDMPDPTPSEIPNITPNSSPQEIKKLSVGWTIFWLISFTPVGWYYVWKKTDWSVRTKAVVIILTGLIFVGLLIESELIVTQIVGNILGGYSGF